MIIAWKNLILSNMKLFKLDIKTIFKIIGAAAVAANLLLELRIPAKKDDKLTNNKNGK